MTDAAVGFLSELASFDIRTPAIPLYSNMTAEPYGGDLAALLAGQICAPVLWSRTILNMIKAGVRTFIEVGPGKVLSGLITRISTDVKVLNVCDAASLAEAAAALNEAEAAAELNEAEAAAAMNEAEAAAALRGGRRVAKG
jgi:[acyl-carrier-protein] S-malonyltransferase